MQEKQYLEAKLDSQKAELEADHRQQFVDLQSQNRDKAAAINQLQSELLSKTSGCESLEQNSKSLKRNSDTLLSELDDTRKAASDAHDRLEAAENNISKLEVCHGCVYHLM